MVSLLLVSTSTRARGPSDVDRRRPVGGLACTDPAQSALTANFQERFTNDRRLYGEIELSAFGPTSGPVTEAGTADLILFMRTIHAWMAAGIAEKAFADAFAALRPGGVLGVRVLPVRVVGVLGSGRGHRRIAGVGG